MKVDVFIDNCERIFDLQNLTLSDEYYYNSLPLCVIDAVFSIGVKYTSTRNTVERYSKKYGLTRINRNQCSGYDNHTIENLIDNLNRHSIYDCADLVFCNHQRTSSRNGILKAEAVLRFANVLFEDGILNYVDLHKKGLSSRAESKILNIPGQHSGLSLIYFYMLTGNNEFSKPDRHVLRFISHSVGENIDITQAQKIMKFTIDNLSTKYPNLTVRMLDHAIWGYMSSKTKNRE